MSAILQSTCSLCAPAHPAPVLCDRCKRDVDQILAAAARRKVWICGNCNSERFATDNVPAVLLPCVHCGYKNLALVEL